MMSYTLKEFHSLENIFFCIILSSWQSCVLEGEGEGYYYHTCDNFTHAEKNSSEPEKSSKATQQMTILVSILEFEIHSSL